MDREQQIIRASIVNVLGNVLLSVAKGAAGVASGSVAIVLDAVNSLIDALGSVIAIIGTKLAGRSASDEHPYGFGRMEYVTSIAIAALILSAGISSFVEAMRAIIHPTTPSYGFVSLAIVAVASVVKFGLGAYLLRKGKKIGSSSLIGSGTDSFMDGGVSVSTFVAGIIYLTTGLQIESLLAAGIALLIIKSGAELLWSTLSKLLGERIDPEVADKVAREVSAVDEVQSASGLALLDFGPDQVVGTVHLTVDGNMTVSQFDRVARKVRAQVEEKHGITLAGITPYPANSADEDVHEVREAVKRIAGASEHVVELRGLYADLETRSVRFDAVADFSVKDLDQLREDLEKACSAEYPEWRFEVRVLLHVAD